MKYNYNNKSGGVIICDGIKFTIVKKYNNVVWRLKSETGEIINVFYSLSEKFTYLL